MPAFGEALPIAGITEERPIVDKLMELLLVVRNPVVHIVHARVPAGKQARLYMVYKQ